MILSINILEITYHMRGIVLQGVVLVTAGLHTEPGLRNIVLCWLNIIPMCCWSNIPISNTISSLCLFNLLPYVILLYFTLLQCFDLISSALFCPKPNMLNRTSQYYDDHQTNALSNVTSSWDYPIFREHLISRSRCNIWCSVRAQGSPCRCFVATWLKIM